MTTLHQPAPPVSRRSMTYVAWSGFACPAIALAMLTYAITFDLDAQAAADPDLDQSFAGLAYVALYLFSSPVLLGSLVLAVVATFTTQRARVALAWINAVLGTASAAALLTVLVWSEREDTRPLTYDTSLLLCLGAVVVLGLPLVHAVLATVVGERAPRLGA